MNAPLSSPSLGSSAQNQQRSYFPSSSTSSSASSSTSIAAQSSGSTSATSSQTQTAQAPAVTQAQSIPRDTTTPFRRDFSLVAEAAKRAQIAVLMRDFESVGISE